MAYTTSPVRGQRRSSLSYTVSPRRTVSLRVTADETLENLLSPKASRTSNDTPLLQKFLESTKELERYCSGEPILVDGQNISIAAVTAAARFGGKAIVDESPATRERMQKSINVIANKVNAGLSVYGVSTGFGGSADTRTDKPLLLGNALLQLLQAGVLPSTPKVPKALPLLDPLASSSMPEAWVRGAILVRMNSLIRGHSGVRVDLVKKMNDLLDANITPLVPLRGSISASGDLSPLSYVAGTLVGGPAIRVFNGPAEAREICSAPEALKVHNIDPIKLASKEHLGLLNGTAFSAAVASLALNDAVHMALLTSICTAMGVEALAGTRASFDPFIHNIARPHPGQIESAKLIWDLLEGSTFASCHEEEVSIAEDNGKLRQDRYALRTAPQFIGPQLEGLLESLKTISIENNSTTDNPIVDGETGQVHHGGNFQATSVTNVMEKTRLGLYHFGKLLFSQSTELMNPAMNRGLPPSLAATDPSLNYHTKGIDIATAAYVSELGFLANPVSTNIQSTDMHNQAVNSLALISARATVEALGVLSLIIASYLYTICQALDLRALQKEFLDDLRVIVAEELKKTVGQNLSLTELSMLTLKVYSTMEASFESTSTMNAPERMQKMAASSTVVLLDHFTSSASAADYTALGVTLATIPNFRSQVASRAYTLLDSLRSEYLSGARGPAPASKYLNKTRPVYEFVRCTLGIKMHGVENYKFFENGLGVEEESVGQRVSLIHEAIRDGSIQSTIAGIFA